MAGEKILLVDDDRDLIKALTVRLKANGYAVAAAFDGISAVSAVRREKPDLVLLDIGLPAGDGFTVIQRINQLTSTYATPVIFLTARGDIETEIDAALEGSAGFVTKPFDSEQLLSLIRETLDKQSGKG